MGVFIKILFRVLIILIVLAFCFSFVFNRWIEPDPSQNAKDLLPNSTFVDVDDVTFHIERHGSGQDVMVFLGDYGSTTATWRFLSAAYAGPYTTIAVDLEGFGYSTKSESIDYSMKRRAERLSMLFKTLDVEHVTLVANGFGGSEALAFAQYHPSYVKQLVLIGPQAYRPFSTVPSFFYKIPEISKAAVKLFQSEKKIEQRLKQGYYKSSILTAEDVTVVTKPLQVQGTYDAYLKIATTGDDKAAKPEKISSIPTLLLWGEKDRFEPRVNMERLRADLVDATLVTLPNVGHLAQEEAPDMVVEELNKFLQK